MSFNSSEVISWIWGRSHLIAYNLLYNKYYFTNGKYSISTKCCVIQIGGKKYITNSANIKLTLFVPLKNANVIILYIFLQ